GDPSMMIYFSAPDSMNITFLDTVPTGIDNVYIKAEPYAYVALSSGGQLLDARYTELSGSVLLQFQELTDTGTLDLVITKQNREPFIDSIKIVSAVGPHVVFDDFSLSDSIGNGNSQADYNELLFLNITLKNLGLADASGISGNLSTTDPYVTVVDSTADWGDLGSAESGLLSRAFLVSVRDTIPDEHGVTFKLRVEDILNNEWISYFKMDIHSPVLEIGKLRINDLADGNGNFKLDPGENVNLILEIINNGHSQANNVKATIGNPDSLSTIIDPTVITDTLVAESKCSLTFPVRISDTADPGTITSFKFILESPVSSLTDSFSFPIGLIYEDFELFGFSQYNWENDTIHPWEISEINAFEGELSAHSGLIGNNDTSVLAITVEVMDDDTISFYRKVSSESNYDYLKFYIDTLTVKWSGEKPWTLEKFPVTAGTHTFKWIYSKDGSVSKGFDKAWIDFVVFPKNSFTRYDAGIVDIISPISGFELSDDETISVMIRNFGTEPLTDIPVTYLFNSHEPVTDTLKNIIDPGSEYVHTFSEKADLSNYKKYNLTVFVSLPGDEFQGNNQMERLIENLAFIDAGIESIYEPIEKTTYSDQENVSVVVRNYGTVSVSNFWVYYSVNNAPPAGELLTGTINPGESLNFTFSEKADLSAYQIYNIDAYTQLGGDVFSQNDSVSISIEHENPDGIHLYSVRQDNLRIYPNPVKGEIHLSFEIQRETKLTISLRNILGQLMQRENLLVQTGQHLISYDLEYLHPGIYFVSFESEDGLFTRKFIKE
ncbi:MAG: T9SS type A sorting domain-containing protein, partial [Bacteroidales bacterium]